MRLVGQVARWGLPRTPLRPGQGRSVRGEQRLTRGHVRDVTVTGRQDMLCNFNNTTADDNSTATTGEPGGQPETAPRWALVGLSTIPVWILFGNMLVLLAVLWNKNLRTLSNCVIASLAATDFMLALLVVPLGTYQVVNGRWDLGLIPCLVWTGSDVFLSTASIMHLCAIAIHRYLGISYPLHFRNNADKRQVLALLVPSWLVSCVIAMPLIVQGIRNREHVLIVLDDIGPQCGIFDHVFAIYSSMVSFFLPLAVMIFTDVRSVQILRKNSKVSIQPNNIGKTRSRHPISPVVTCSDPSAYELTASEAGSSCAPHSPMVEYKASASEQNLVSGNLSPLTTPRSEFAPNVKFASKRRKAKKTISYIGILSTRGMIKLNSRERRAEKTLIWVFVCFIVLWLPFFCTNLTYGICRACEIPSDLFMSFTWLGYISSGVNPCIYTFLNKDFRNAFKRIILCRFGADLVRKPTM